MRLFIIYTYVYAGKKWKRKATDDRHEKIYFSYACENPFDFQPTVVQKSMQHIQFW